MFRSFRSGLSWGNGRAVRQSDGRGDVPAAAYHRTIWVAMRNGHSTHGAIEGKMTLDPAAVFVMLLGILTGVAAWRSSRGTDSSRLINDALTMAKESRVEVKELQDRIDEMENREKQRDTREAELLRGVWILIRQLEAAKIVPQWHPPVYPSDVLGQHSRDRGEPPKQEPPKRRMGGF